MRKAKLAQNVWGWLLMVALMAGASFSAQAQCTLSCNDLVQISVPADCSVELDADQILEGDASIICPNGNLQVQAKINGIWQPSSGNFVVTTAHVGLTLQVRVRDISVTNGNSCWGYIKVEDKLAPVLTCFNLEVPCTLSPASQYEPQDLQNLGFGPGYSYPAVEECDDYTWDYTDTWIDLTCDDEDDLSGVVERIWTVTDASGNAAYCVQYILFERAHFYDVTFPADYTVDCSDFAGVSPSVTGAPYVTYDYNFDNEGSGEYTSGAAGDGPFGEGVDYPVYPDPGYCELQTVYTDQKLPVCDGTYKILRTWTVYDWCLPTGPIVFTTAGIQVVITNPAYYVQVIKVTDESGPTFVTYPEDITVSTNPSQCCATVDLGSYIVTDDCSRINDIKAQIAGYGEYGDFLGYFNVGGTLQTFPGNNLWNRDTLANFGLTPCLPIGTHEVYLTLTDNCGNHGYGFFYLTVEDQTVPEVACVEWTQVALGVAGETLTNASSFDNGSYDNCGPVYFKVRRMDPNPCQDHNDFYDQARFCCSDLGDTITVILRVYDINPGAAPVRPGTEEGGIGQDEYEGHYNDCMVQVLVEDKLKPVCQAPAFVTVSCENFDPSLWAYGEPSATDNCCVDTITRSVSYASFDTVCNRGTIVRTFRAFDCGGLSSQCTQRIVVTYGQYYFVKFPDDKTVGNCTPGGDYGKPTFYGEDCELLATSFVDEVFTVNDGACFKIERTWTVINWCTYNQNNPCIFVPNPNPLGPQANQQQLTGPTVSAPNNGVPGWTASVFTLDPGTTPWNYGTQTWAANANCYKYKQIIKVYDNNAPVVTADPYTCDPTKGTTNDPQLWNSMFWYEAATNSHDMCEEPTDLTLSATDLCAGANLNVSYLLFLDLDNSGDMETVVNSLNPLASGQLQPGEVLFGNAGSPNFLSGQPQRFDFRLVPNTTQELAVQDRWVFSVYTAASGANRTAKVVFRRGNQAQADANSPTVQLPYGTHKIKWIVEDGCGNQTVKEVTFTVGDCKKPTVVCKNGLSVNIMQTGMVTIWASDFLLYGEDNCTPAGLLKYGIRKSGTGSGFPTETSVTFDCTELGTQFVELWAQDKAGNADFCETYILVQDNMGACPNTSGNASIAGALKTEDADGVEAAQVDVNGSANGAPVFNQVFSNVNGNYAFSNALPIGGNYTVTPNLNDDPTNGVTTYDLVLINRHILGLEPLSTPHKMIAADANKSNTITTFDIVEIRKLILGIYNEFPANNSWRFVDQTQVFSNPQNPFADVIREDLTIANIQANMGNGNFTSVKIGDVNGTATPNATAAPDDRSAGTLFFDINNEKVVAGQEVVVNFKAAEKQTGYQFTMNMNGLEVVGITPGANMSEENFAVFNNAITTSVDGGAGEFAVKFRATQAGELSNMLGVSSRITKAEAYSVAGDKLDVAFRFNGQNGSVVAGANFELLQNTPNPVKSATNIAFNLPSAGAATLTITNVEGRVLKVVNGTFAKGLNTVTINRGELETGVLFYQLNSADFSATKKMVVVE